MSIPNQGGGGGGGKDPTRHSHWGPRLATEQRWQEGICGQTLREGWEVASRKLTRELSYPFYSQSNLREIEAAFSRSDADLSVTGANIAIGRGATTALVPGCKLH